MWDCRLLLRIICQIGNAVEDTLVAEDLGVFDMGVDRFECGSYEGG